MKTELDFFYREYSNMILYSLCHSNNFFSFKKGVKSRLSKNLLEYNLDRIIEQACYYLVKDGKYTLYYKIEEVNNDVNFFLEPDLGSHKIDFEFPENIISEKKRKKFIQKLTLLDEDELYNEDDIIKRIKFASKMRNEAIIKVAELGKYFYINDIHDGYYNDYYSTYRKINQMISQRKLVDYILTILNKKLIEILNLDEGDIIIFNGITIEKLNKLMTQLEQGTKPVVSIFKELVEK